MAENDERVRFLLDQVAVSFKYIAAEKLTGFKQNEANVALLEAFCNGEKDALFCCEKRAGLELTPTPPKGVLKTERGEEALFLYLLKTGGIGEPVSRTSYASQIVVGECSSGVLEHAEQVAATVFAPLLSGARAEWSELIAREVDESLSAFVANVQIIQGHVDGRTQLPLPPDWAVEEDARVIHHNHNHHHHHHHHHHTHTSEQRPSSPALSSNDDGDASSTKDAAKDAVHALESSIITWTKQMKAVLKLDPETSLATGATPHPGPVAEMDFWLAKARNLNSIFEQLQSVRVRKVLRCLDGAASTYNAPFAKLCKELFVARAEANDNARFVEPLRKWAAMLEGECAYDSLDETFAPLVHTVLLIWKASQFYNTPTRLVVLLREVCSALVTRSIAHLRGGGGGGGDDRDIFELIVDGDEARDAVELLKSVLKTLQGFKHVYLTYKKRSEADCPKNPWRVQNNAVFVRLDAFWERVHDLLELTQTTMQFSKLSKIEVGGTKGKVLTTSVHQIAADFATAVAAVRRHGHERLLDVEAKEFDEAFYEFRVTVKELERRLASVLTQGFDDAPTLTGRFKILDAFDALVRRPVIADELERKYVELVVDYGTDVRDMQNAFMLHKDNPPIARNLPPIAGALTWCRGLVQRVELPMGKLRLLDKKVMEREEAREVVQDFTAFVGQLSDYERSKIEAWGDSVEVSSQAKLKNPLLRFEPENSNNNNNHLISKKTTSDTAGAATSPPRKAFSLAKKGGPAGDEDAPRMLLYVNFDPLLVRLLREVKYFLLLGFTAPGAALEIYQHSEVFRRHMGNLDLIVNMYNWMQTSLLPVERPLLRNQLDKIDKLLSQGVGAQQRKEIINNKASQRDLVSLSLAAPAATAKGDQQQAAKGGGGKDMKVLNWKSANIDLFINEAMSEVREVSATISVMKANLHRVEELLDLWSTQPLIRRSTKSATIGDFELMQRSVLAAAFGPVSDGGTEIHKLLRDTNRKLKVSQGLPDWKAYVDFVNNLVVAGLLKVVVISCTRLEQQLDPVWLAKHQPGPMLEIDLDLLQGEVRYIPEIGETTEPPEDHHHHHHHHNGHHQHQHQRALRTIFRDWLDNFSAIARVFKRLDTGSGHYLRELQDDPTVQWSFARIEDRLNVTEKKLKALRHHYSKYEYLWKTDLQQMFADFLETAVPQDSPRTTTEDDDDDPSTTNNKNRAEEANGLNNNENNNDDDDAAGSGGGPKKTPRLARRDVDDPPATLGVVVVSDGGAPEEARGDEEKTVEEEAAVFGGEGLLRLDLFEEQLIKHLEVQAEIEELKPQHEVDFVRIMAQPMKQALGSWVTKWMFTFTNYLQGRIMRSLHELYEFMSTVDEGLDVQVVAAAEHNKRGLMLVMTHIRDVRKRMPTMDAELKPLREMVALLKQHGIALDLGLVGENQALDFLETAPLMWDNVVNKTFRVKESIQPFQNAMVDEIKRDIADYGDRVKRLHAQFRNVTDQDKSPLCWGADRREDAYREIAKSEAKLRTCEAEAESFANLQELFELNRISTARLVEMRQELVLLKQVWDVIFVVESLVARWKRTLWLDIDCDALMDENKLLIKMVRKLPRRAKGWPCFRTLEARVANVAVILPLVADLHSPAMRERHWKQVAAVTGGHGGGGGDGGASSSKATTIEHKTATFCLADLFALQLHEHVDGIEEVVEVANKEHKVEAKLRAIEAYWGEAEFEVQRHRDTEVRVIVPPDDLLEALEEHHVQVQSIAVMGRAVEYFRAELATWQSMLGNIEQVMKAILSVQRSWMSLEAIFLASHDIRAQLPDDTKRFEAIDHDFKDLMRDIGAAPGLIPACSLEGREQSLRSMTRELEICQKALAEYLDMKKNIFPRFYFVSNMALLDILSNSNTPVKIMPHIGSVFDGVNRLVLLGEKEILDDEAAAAAAFAASSSSRPTSRQSRPSRGSRGSLFFVGDDLESLDAQSVASINTLSSTTGGGGPRGKTPTTRRTRSSTKRLAALNKATAMRAKDGEEVAFPGGAFGMDGAVERWLNELVVYIRDSLRVILDAAITDVAAWDSPDKPREDWVAAYPAQVCLVTSQTVWTDETEAALNELEDGTDDAVRKHLEILNARLDALVTQAQGHLDAGLRNKTISLITIDVHSRDLVQQLIAKKVETALDFTWASQMRYYWQPEPTREVEIRICDFKTVYSFEYIGNCGRLVITPLTDRCYVTLTTALRLFLGGAPAGPAGTGKTETTKDLARGLGLPCYVFNCSDQMNYQTMGDIFRGLSQAGAWGCFDEFNRIEIEVLSVVATQVKLVLDASARLSEVANREPAYAAVPAGTPPVKIGEFDFFGDKISLVPTCGFFITMNPGYAGRTELPENLKASFRSCAMIRPDLKPICENMLMAEGFIKARPLAAKFVTLYRLSEDLLSKQAHYDWGLRAVKSVLRVAGTLKRAEPDLDEEAVLMRALRDFNTPKIPAVDTPIFLRLIADLFPGLDLAPKTNEALMEMCAEVCAAEGLQYEDAFALKVVQFQELLDVRHSVMILGPPGSGKSTIYKTLAACHNMALLKGGGGAALDKRPVCVYEALDPKSVTSDELYGHMTLAKDWRDGCLSIVMRNMSNDWAPYTPHQAAKWVVLDGDIDAVWIESMNTVMDDNKVLTLVSNERIPLTPAMRMVFEVDSLKNATPATVSRAGILYINELDIGWMPFAESWVAKRPHESERATLPLLLNKYVPELCDMLKERKIETLTPVCLISRVVSLLHVVEALLANATANDNNSNNNSNNNGAASKNNNKASPTERIERLFLFATMWAFGGVASSDSTNVDSRKSFSEGWRSLVKGSAFKGFPEAGTCFEYFVDPATGDIAEWADQVPKYEPVGVVQYASIVVPTGDFVAVTSMTTDLALRKRPVLLVGAAGTGKTLLIRDFLRNLPEQYLSKTLNMNYYTDATALQQQLEQPLEKRSGKSFGPPGSKLLAYFVDDLNMPFVETYGTQTPIALMRQHLDYGSWYDRTDLSLRKSIHDTQYVAAMNHKAGSFQVSPRLQRHFTALGCQASSVADLGMIYASILESHLSNASPAFDAPVVRVARAIVDATLSFHAEMQKRFLPSAVKFHYNFNMRHLSAVFQGLCLAVPQHTRLPITLARLWLHECARVYADRLVSPMAVHRCNDVLVDVAKRCLDIEESDALFAEPNVWTTFATPTVDGTAVYLPVKSTEALRKTLENMLTDYNEANPIMNLVLFDQATLHVTRIARIIGRPYGNALLIGVGGSGKQSLAKLASFICGSSVSQISVTSSYGVPELKEELKDLYRRAGVRPAEPLTFIMTDTQIVDEQFLVYINDLLSSGFIPDLFARDEYDAIFGQLRNTAKAAGVADTPESMMEFFIDRVNSNLHMVLCFSPIGDLIRVRARKFPGLINCCSIDWFQPWSKDALVSVAQHFLEGVDLGATEVHDNIAHHVADVHISVGAVSDEYRAREKRFNYVTPTSYLELITFYKTLLGRRRGDLEAMIVRLDTGLKTLRATNEDVTRLKGDLKVRMVEVEEKKFACEKFLEEMGQQRGQAEAAQAEADRERSKADVLAKGARDIEDRCAADLALAKPALDAALDAVNCLDKASMTELKSFQKPPPGVDKVTAALLILVKNEKRNFSWENAKKMMAKVDAFKEQLESFDGENIPADVVARCEPYLADPNFSYEKMKTKSAAAANLCHWVVNIIGFNQVYKKVKPLMEELDEATTRKTQAEHDLAVVEHKLQVIDAALDKLQNEFLAATQEKSAVEKLARDCSDRLVLAERLTSGLASEYTRWGHEVDRLRVVEATLVGDVVLSAAFVSYAGAFGAKFREILYQDHWVIDLQAREIPLAPTVFEPMRLLATESEIASWMGEGLPADRVSIENGAIVNNCSRWPLLIDPQLQGIRWILQREEFNRAQHAAEEMAPYKPLTLVQLGEKNWVLKVIAAIQGGLAIIIENLGQTIDAVLDPVLARSVVRRGKTLFLRMGGDDLEYDPDFCLYLQTRLANPHYRPEIAARCTLINFIVTETGLEEQLLARVVSAEQPELEKEKDDLTKAFNRYKIDLKHLEDDLLFKLANAPADILGDLPLIEGLEKTKKTAGEISEAVERGKAAETGINEAREVYRPVAEEASQIYFALLKLNRIDHVYQYSLESFVKFFKNGMKAALQAGDAALRVERLLESVRWTVFQWVSRGLFEKHRLVFAVQLCLGLLQQGLLTNINITQQQSTKMSNAAPSSETSDEAQTKSKTTKSWASISRAVGFSAEGLHFLLRGTRKATNEEPPAGWVTPAAWEMLNELGASVEGFEKLPSDLATSAPRFQEWFNAATPEAEKLPLDWRDLEKRPFQKLLVIRALRPDRLTPALRDFVARLLPRGERYCNLDADLSSYGVLEQAFVHSAPSVPIYFILSPGANVVADVDRLVKKEGMERGLTYHNISLGQGQDVVAAEKLHLAHRLGHWIMLNNVHLMPNWLRDFEKMLDDFASKNSQHPAFRVFLSSEPTRTIPIGILDRSIKLTSDPPSGLKANLRQAFGSFNREDFEDVEPRTRGILFGLCHFHALLLERRKFGPQGTNLHYPFAIGDLTSSASVLRNYMENAPTKVPWPDLRYLFGEIMYGGHIVDDNDRLVCAEYLNFFMRDQVLDEMELAPYPDDNSRYNTTNSSSGAKTGGMGGGAGTESSFHAPESSLPYDKVLEHIDASEGLDSPIAFGLHPNAEVGFRTETSNELCRAVMDLSTGGGGGAFFAGEEASSSQNVAEAVLQDILEQLRDASFDIDGVLSLIDEPGAFHNVFLQECALMNTVLTKVAETLEALELGFRGELTMSEAMERLQESLFLDRVPEEWARIAFPSQRALSSWVLNLGQRIAQLREWCAAPTDKPPVTWLAGLFQPASFLTAIMQATAQANRLELDTLVIVTEMTKKTDIADVTTPSRDGAYVHGLFLQGARWSVAGGILEPPNAGEMFSPVPIVNCKALPATPAEATLAKDGIFACPCYKTLRRGPTFVFYAGLKTKAPPAKWVLAGTALIMDVADS